MKILNTADRRNRVFGERVTIPEFEIVSCPTVRLSAVCRRRLDVIIQKYRNAQHSIIEEADRCVFEALDSIPPVSPAPLAPPAVPGGIPT